VIQFYRQTHHRATSALWTDLGCRVGLPYGAIFHPSLLTQQRQPPKIQNVVISFQMERKNLFASIFAASLFSVSPLTFSPAKAEGGCPSGFVPIGGGYCRNIVCPQSNILAVADRDTEPVMKKYGLKCSVPPGIYQIDFGKWGDQIIPKR
jgi:hypothetical protein